MEKFDPEIHHRRSIRLNGFDYSQPACYFITITTKDRENLFGQIINGKMILNDAGKLIDEQWNNLAGRFTHIKLDEYVVMPNHLHGIINIVGAIVGADQCVCPDNDNKFGEHMGSPLRSEPTGSISKIVQWFKTMTTNAYIRNVKQNHFEPFDGKLWQRNFYEQIIRNEESMNRIREYIRDNPVLWQKDNLYK